MFILQQTVVRENKKVPRGYGAPFLLRVKPYFDLVKQSVAL